MALNMKFVRLHGVFFQTKHIASDFWTNLNISNGIALLSRNFARGSTTHLRTFSFSMPCQRQTLHSLIKLSTFVGFNSRYWCFCYRSSRFVTCLWYRTHTDSFIKIVVRDLYWQCLVILIMDSFWLEACNDADKHSHKFNFTIINEQTSIAFFKISFTRNHIFFYFEYKAIAF